MDKAEVARRLLGTATDLFLNDHDPVSVHTLACAGCEILEIFPAKTGRMPFAQHMLQSNPEMDITTLRNLQRKYYNAFKHAASRNGSLRDDRAVLEDFSDRQNDAALFIGWYDFSNAFDLMPVEAQALEAWYFATHPQALALDHDPQRYKDIFPGVVGMNRPDQKAMLRNVIQKARRDSSIMVHPKTDPRPLMMPLDRWR